jgi:8-oxo-dGTP pyrophosphatase MutT (NUDIX family)
LGTDRRHLVKPGPVKPADAAGLVLIRAPKSGEAEILIGRRPSRMGFLPGIHVMPGGRVDPPDAQPSGFPGAPHPAVAAALTGQRPPIAFLNAALRETYEETGLLAGRPFAGAPGNHPSPFWQAYAEAGLAPDYAGLDYLCRAITPVTSKRRFNTRFFLGDGNHVAGALAGNGELEDLGWRKVSKLGDLNLVDVTQYALETALRRWNAQMAIGAEAAKLLNYRKDIMTLSRERSSRR